jgi:hypothetical protein
MQKENTTKNLPKQRISPDAIRRIEREKIKDFYYYCPILLFKKYIPSFKWPKIIREIFNELYLGDATRAIIKGPRGGGKSQLVSALIFCIWFFKERKVVDMGGAFAQAKIVYNYILEYLNSDENILNTLEKPPLMQHTIDKKGNYLKCLSASQKQVRGPHPDVLAIDETCFVKNQLVITNNGIKKIKDIDFKDKLLNKNGCWQNIKRIFKRKVDEEIIEIKPFYNPYGIKLTKNHSVKIIKRSYVRGDWWREHLPDVDWIKAENIKKNDALVYPLSKNDKSIDKEWEWFIGLYIAEGSTNNYGKIYISLHSKEVEHIKRVKKIIKQRLNKNVSVYKFKNCNGVNLQFGDKKLAKWLNDNCGHRAKNKRIPNRYATKHTIRGIIDGDGCIVDGRIRLHIASRVLTYQVQRFYLNEKKFCSLFHRPKHYQLEVNLNPIRHFGWFDDNNFYPTIRSVRNIKYKGWVYNFETEDNTYIVPSATVHNCECKDELVDAAIPMVDTSQNPLIVMTSTFHKIFGVFQDVWDNAIERGYKRFSWDIFDVVRKFNPEIWEDERLNKEIPDLNELKKLSKGKTGDPEGWIKIENVIQAWREKPTLDYFLVEYMGNRPSQAGLVNNPEDVDACVYNLQKMSELGIRYKIGSECVLGIDWGFSSMTSIVDLMYWKDDKKLMLDNKNYTQVQLSIIIDDIVELLKKRPRKYIYADSAGKFENDDLQKRLNEDYNNGIIKIKPIVVEVVFGKEKEELLGCYRSHFQKKLLIIPDKFKTAIWQHKRYRYQEGSDKPLKKDDHIPDATLCALKHFNKPKTGHLSDIKDIDDMKTITGGLLDKKF